MSMSTGQRLSPPTSPPVCPGCDRPSVARPCRGVIRWACLTPDCPVVDMGLEPPPRERPGTRARRVPRDAAQPTLLLDVEPFHPG